MPNDHWIGQMLNGRYRIDQLLGQGGMSSVYQAYDPNLRRTVAIKLIHPHLSTNPDFLRRFEEEAASVATLRNENIVQVFDFNHDGDVYYMVLEYLPGETLEERLKRWNAKNLHIDQGEAVRIITQICDAVHYAHKRGLIHRDIKPANIMLDELDRAILMDFGIARIVGGQIHTAAGAVVGTALYMSPEQIQGEQVDARTDIYSLGVTLFETLSGKPPFEADSAMTLMMMHLSDPVPDIRHLRPRVVDSLIAVIAKALEKKRENRYQSAAEMAAALRLVSVELAQDTSHLTLAPVSPVQETPVEIPAEPARPIQPAVPLVPPPAEIETKVSTYPIGPAEKTPERDAAALGTALPAGKSVVPPPVSRASPARKRLNLVWIGLAAVAFILFLFIAVGATLILSRSGGIAGILSAQTRTPATAAIIPTPVVVTQVVTAIATAAQAAPTLNPTAQPLANAGSNPPADQPYYIRIDQITIQNGRYIAEYTTFGFTEKLDAMNIHFFFNTVSPVQAGVPGKGPWVLFGGPHPFKGMTLASRPLDATQLCALVANPDHTVLPNSGNCIDLPQN